ncbi:integrase catalytic domain-containing protein [Trichonephila clavipes]|nr:integrase catalytic domain-containing protein [Trichonephila clavipes]
MTEELHRPLKSAIKCHATERWTEVLPIILLGLRASLKEDILCTPAELVFETTIRLPGEMFDSSKPDDDVVNFVSKLKSYMQSLHPKPPKHHGKRPVFIHPGLLEATHVFLRRDICKPAFFLNTEDLQLPQTKNETPATVESDPTASTPTQPSTRSGRKVHLPTRKKQDMLQLAEELGINATLNMTVPSLKIAITNSEGYEEEFVKNLYETIIANGKRLEELERAEKMRLEELERAEKNEIRGVRKG